MRSPATKDVWNSKIERDREAERKIDRDRESERER